jgi:hypothetical protein
VSEEFILLVDALLRTPKVVVGDIRPSLWQPRSSSDVRRLVLPLAVDGEAKGVSIQVLAYPNWHNLKFKINLSIPPDVWRVCFDSEDQHNNSRRKSRDNVPPGVRGSHHHPWEQNKRFVRNINKLQQLENALPLPFELTNFAETFSWFCDQINVIDPPSFALPLRETLI